jgi:hypothetical protein
MDRSLKRAPVQPTSDSMAHASTGSQLLFGNRIETGHRHILRRPSVSEATAVLRLTRTLLRQFRRIAQSARLKTPPLTTVKTVSRSFLAGIAIDKVDEVFIEL